ncbi:MAG: Gfo/Idh/MocA family oxidoreductase [Bryobacteraceae bacterium]|nr:Gfo/Idh/MocA family oxidoreductase [Bryobacteraceae bacterium]
MKSDSRGHSITRRQALQRSAGAFLILPSGLARGYAANNKLDIGVIGLAGMGGVDASTLHKLGENIAALCDVDAQVLERRGAEYPKAARYTDFRKMIEKEKLDGVVVATPDHSHAYISVWAMKHGLHVYCQKPLCQTVHEARVMAQVAAETGVITQMGTSSTSEERNMRTVELIQSGALGEITEVHVMTDRPVWPQGFERPPGEDPVPPHLDWDLWLGPAPLRPYQSVWPAGHKVYWPDQRKRFIYHKEGDIALYHPFMWRGWIEFGSGAVGDIAPHSMNVIFWALDLGAPAAVEVVETSGMAREMYPEWSVIRWEWPQRGVHPPLKIYWYDGGKTIPDSITGGRGGGLVWIGTKGSLPPGRGPYLGQKTEPYVQPPPREWGREEVHKDWVEGIKRGKQPGCDMTYAGPFTEAYQLADVALRVGHRIEWDPLAFRITNCREAHQYLTREYRKGWELKEIAGRAYEVRPPEKGLGG